MHVCKRWNEACSAPKLWSWVIFKIQCPNLPACMAASMHEHHKLFLEMICLPRLQAARRIQFNNLRVNNEIKLTLVVSLLGNALSHPGLKQLVIHGGDFRTVEPNLLAKFLTKMEEVDLSYHLMST